jgi:predicted HTH transcriptional regulator
VEAILELTELLRDGEAALQRAIDAQEVETLTLDFKEVGQGKEALFADGKVSKQGQLVIGPAASAFANSAGGLLVIGVRCKVMVARCNHATTV